MDGKEPENWEEAGEENAGREKRHKLLGFIIYSILEETAIGAAILLPLLILAPSLLLLGAVVVAIGLAVFTAVKVYIYLSVTSTAPRSEFLIGREAVAITDFEPAGGNTWTGLVRIYGEEWRAVADHPITRGERLLVTARKGLRIYVTPSRQ